MAVASAAGVRVVLNLAPVQQIDTTPADPLVVNEVELAQLLGVEEVDDETLERRAEDISSLARSVVVTRGEAGAAWIAGGTLARVPAPPATHVVDTTGAGDALVGVLAASLAAGDDPLAALERAVRAASQSVGRVGAADSYADIHV